MKVFLALGLGLQLAAAKVSYDGYKVFHIDAPEDQYEEVQHLIQGLDFVSLSCESDHQSLDIAVAPSSLEEFEHLGFNATVVTEDLGADIAEEGEVTTYKSSPRAKGAAAAALPDISYFNSYKDLAGHQQFLRDLQASFPSNSALFTVGNSVEGRAIQGIHIWGSAGQGKRPGVVWHGTVHAREWIVAPTVEYMAYKLIEGYQNRDSLILNTLNNFDFYILPIVNPDGFVYTTSSDRLWRKNRQRRSGQSCIGTDVNRNWPYQWSVPGGSSTNPCSETYRGAAAGDTPENKALVAHTQNIARTTGIKFYVDWHSFSQLILLPYGYSCSARFDDLSRQMTLAQGVAGAIRGVNGLSFTYGPTCETIYQTSGSSLDWAFDVAGAELSWSLELRPASGGSGGFVVPASNIVPSGNENWAGMRNLFGRW